MFDLLCHIKSIVDRAVIKYEKILGIQNCRSLDIGCL